VLLNSALTYPGGPESQILIPKRPEQSENYAVSASKYLYIEIVTFILPKGTYEEKTRMNKKVIKLKNIC